MTTPEFVPHLFGWRANGKPNCSDANSNASVQIAARMMEHLGVSQAAQGPLGDAGAALEVGVAAYLETELAGQEPGRSWLVSLKQAISDFRQYRHLSKLQALIDGDTTKTLAAEIGRDYLVKPDVTVGVDTDSGPLLHASVSCKWTLRSDRAQNVRHEAVILTRHRRGRQPHIVAVTAEPLASRIASLARGTGEIDAVYHVALGQLEQATSEVGTALQKETLDELVGQDRLYDIGILVDVLSER